MEEMINKEPLKSQNKIIRRKNNKGNDDPHVDFFPPLKHQMSKQKMLPTSCLKSTS